MSKKPRTHLQIGKTNAAILAGETDVRDWDEEELTRGQRRDKNGGWVGRPPRVVPMEVHNELVRRKMSKAYELLRDNLVEATTVLVEIAKDPEVDPGVRLKAVGMIQDRVLGKAPERVEISAAERKPWEDAIRGGIVRIAPEAIDASSTEAESA